MSDDKFGDEGVIEGAGTAGSKTRDWAEKVLRGGTDAQVNMAYGITAWVTTGLALILYFSLNNVTWVMGALYWAFIITELAWAPVSIIWMSLAFWDASWLRKVYESVITISFLGPFAGYWVALIMFMLSVDEVDCWGCWQTWVTIPIWTGWSIFSMIMQIAMVPKVFDWTENAPVNPNKSEKKRKNSEEDSTADEDNFLAAF